MIILHLSGTVGYFLSSLFCLSVFAPPIVNWSFSLGWEIDEIPFPIRVSHFDWDLRPKNASWSWEKKFVSRFMASPKKTNQWKDWQPLCSQREAARSYIINEWVASYRILVFAQRFLRSPWDKHCNSREGNIWRKVVSTTKKIILERDKRFFPEVLSQMINNDVDAWEVKFFIRITTKYVIKYTDKLLSLRKVYCEIVIA